ncbi:hypothetical protein EJ06DRAFT_119387 [Trichodelitschia bisporula]|uniref:Uncharacterized protein n=1 Tax=Trichodelitschia bisporula TaxID=703511 RepID=A0A6G1HQ61_9PEZI|nr:hypothetical protein EJ06DRAFT_119387 [Trichodelitschia bisporula]
MAIISLGRLAVLRISSPLANCLPLPRFRPWDFSPVIPGRSSDSIHGLPLLLLAAKEGQGKSPVRRPSAGPVARKQPLQSSLPSPERKVLYGCKSRAQPSGRQLHTRHATSIAVASR